MNIANPLTEVIIVRIVDLVVDLLLTLVEAAFQVDEVDDDEVEVADKSRPYC